MSSGELMEIHAIVRGRVRGVGFRATTRHHASKLGLTGSVKNLPDGTVEVYVQGSRELIEELWGRLRSDSGLGRVDEISVDIREPKRPFNDFQIVF